MDADILLGISAMGAVLTALFTAWAVVQRMARTPRPHWEFDDAYVTESDHEPFLSLEEGSTQFVSFVFLNSGDAPAWRVVLRHRPKGAERLLQTGRRTSVGPGEAVEFPTAGNVRFEDRSQNRLMAGDGIWFDTGRQLVEITWHQRPWWWIRRSKKFSLDKIQDGHTFRTRKGPRPTSPR